VRFHGGHMAATKVQIISYAMMLLGKKPIISLVNQNDLTTALEASFDFLYPSMISKGFWRFATQIVQLSQLQQTPTGGYWFFAYQLPGNYLEMVHLWPQMYGWEIYENNLLYTNYNAAATAGNSTPQGLFIEYVFLPLIQNLPSYFVEFMAHRIAADAALSNAQSVQYYQPLLQRADYLWQQAQAKDAQNRPQTQLQNAPMITRRFVSVFVSG